MCFLSAIFGRRWHETSRSYVYRSPRDSFLAESCRLGSCCIVIGKVVSKKGTENHQGKKSRQSKGQNHVEVDTAILEAKQTPF
jgi:hypothetical protein